MTHEESELREQAHGHIRRVKWWLRFLPRRSNLHRYPVLKFFASSARKRSYLWSFRVENAIPAIYAGCLLSFQPLYGIQILLAILLANWLKANLPILVGLQFVSNPLTVWPIWYTCYLVGKNFLSIFSIEALPLRRHEVQIMLDNFANGDWGTNLDRLISVFGVTSLGATMIGLFIGAVLSIAYRLVSNRTVASYKLIIDKLSKHRKDTENISSNNPNI
jgi:uncharacterized protein (DUF2062 family)